MTAAVVVPMVGLAIDGSVSYWLKARLSAAVDAAALAAGRSLSFGSTQQAQENSATQTADTYFAANFPSGTMGTVLVGGQPTVQVTYPGLYKRSVTVQATITAPLYFLPIIGFRTATLAATGQATRRDANVVLVLDRSYSMQEAGVCNTLIASAQNFVNDFSDGRDELALVTFQSTANVDYPGTLHFKSQTPSLSSVIGTMVCNGYTTTAAALNLAYTQIKNINHLASQGGLNVIVLFTDGQPDSIVGTVAIKSQSDTRYDWQNTSSLVSTPASTCNSTDVLTGVITAATGSPDPTGITGGIYSAAAMPITSNTLVPPTINAPGCTFANSNQYYTLALRVDAIALPLSDAFANLTTGYKPLDYYPSGDTYTGSNYPRIDTPRSVMNAAANAADNQANLIRSDPTFTPIIYTIGLGGTQYQQIDSDFLERVANDPRSSGYNSSQPTGLFIYASAGTLASAFQQIASQILRLSQ